MADIAARCADRRMVIGDAYTALFEYLLAHEHDIADEINDFYDLRPVFLLIFNREPEATWRQS